MKIHTAALAAFLLPVLMFATTVSHSETVNEMSMATDVGEIVLTVEPCPITPNHGYVYMAYATDKGNPDHLGCWNEPDPIPNMPKSEIVTILFFEVNAVAAYNKKLFKPRTKL